MVTKTVLESNHIKPGTPDRINAIGVTKSSHSGSLTVVSCDAVQRINGPAGDTGIMKRYSQISGTANSGSRPGTRTRKLVSAIGLWLVAVLTLGFLHAAHAEVLELDEFRYRRLMEHAEAAGYELSAEHQIGNASSYGLIKTTSEPSDTNLYLDFNEEQYLLESLDSM